MARKFFTVLGVILLIPAIILAVGAVVLRFTANTPDKQIFGYSISLMPDVAFYEITENSLLLAEKKDTASLNPGDLILYINEHNTISPGRVTNTADNTLFLSDREGNSFTVGTDKYVGRIRYYSPIGSIIVGFIMSPLGVLVIALLPCLAMLFFDIARNSAAKKKERDTAEEIDIVDKDDDEDDEDDEDEYEYKDEGYDEDEDEDKNEDIDDDDDEEDDEEDKPVTEEKQEEEAPEEVIEEITEEPEAIPKEKEHRPTYSYDIDDILNEFSGKGNK